MMRSKDITFGVEKRPDGRYYETIPASNEQGYVRREISEAEHKKLIEAFRKMFK